ncbi:MAG: right-handed parallel beta-helix repeat-containing protein [Candidatus Electryoneaceae bacterium]|nr:right-handed parallel beta-helix repeat-containing protein [Candidatus Electryoneaceae bacterium]
MIGLIIILTGVGCDDSNPVLPIDNPYLDGIVLENEISGVKVLSGGPYLVQGSLSVPDGSELVVNSGVEIRFMPDTTFDGSGDVIRIDYGSLDVEGKITAIGNEIAPIAFTSARKVPDRGDWDGIWLVDADEDSQFEYCRFMYGGKYGRRYIYGEDPDGDIDSTLWEYGSVTTVRSNPTIERCWFILGGFHGLHSDSSSAPVVENCIFYDNAGHGIYVDWTAQPEIRYNIIIENDDYGLFCRQPTDAPRVDLNIWYNIIWSNFSGEHNPQSPDNLGRIVQMNGNLDSCDYQYNLRLNPEFYDAEGTNDFRLNSLSAAIDAGPEDDDIRDIDGTRIELGIYPYEYRPGEIRRRIPNPPIVGDRLIATNSPYYMSCDVLLPEGETLTIEAGVEVRIEGMYRFRVRGTILSHGTANNPVRFVSASQNPQRGDWFGLIFEAGGDNGTELSYTTISHARWGVRLDRRNALIENCTITECDSVGIFCNDQASPTITNCELHNNSIAGILCQYNSSPILSQNNITNGAYGIYARENSNPDIYNNIIKNNGTTAIRLNNLCTPDIINNTIVMSGYYGVYCLNNSSPNIRNNIFYANGTDDRGGYGIIAENTSQPIVEYNCFWDHPLGPAYFAGTQIELPATNIVEDPLFVDVDGGDFHLGAGSSCRTSGDPNISEQMGAYGGGAE